MAKPAKRDRPALEPVSEEMRHLCSMLAQEMLRWPDVHTRPMFGMRAFYRGTAIFAMLPEKRALETSRSIGYRHPGSGRKWQLFELNEARDIDKALTHLDRAYRRAVK